ncbi:MAG: ABC transporter permease [Fibrobacteres bacterium]|nr:ABC transporter permease [Fibrobacterota bacterium]
MSIIFWKNLFFWAGERFFSLFAYIYELLALFFNTIGAFFKYRKKGRSVTRGDVIFQILFTGVEAIPIIAIIGLMLGSILIIQSNTLAPKLGASSFLGKIMVIGIIRELGPLVTTFIVIGRSGAALSTYLGNMKVTNEIDALEVMGIDPVHAKVLPALFGFIISIFGLTLVFDGIAVMGGFLFSNLIVGMPLNTFLNAIMEELSTIDIVLTAIKCALFGSVVSITTCYHSLSIGYSFQEVPQATIKAVVNSIVFTVLLDTILTVAFYAGFNAA